MCVVFIPEKNLEAGENVAKSAWRKGPRISDSGPLCSWKLEISEAKEESFHQRATAPFLSITTTHRHRDMSQADPAPADDDEIPNITAHEFFSKVPDGVFNLASSYTDLDDYESLHHVIHKNKQCEAKWEAQLRQYAHHAKPLFDVFTSVKSLRFVSVRKIGRSMCRGTGSCIYSSRITMAKTNTSL